MAKKAADSVSQPNNPGTIKLRLKNFSKFIFNTFQ